MFGSSSLNNAKGIFYAIISSSTFGLIPFFSLPLIVDEGLGLPTILFFRFLLSFLIMGGICILKKESFRIEKKHFLSVVWLGLLYAVTALCLIWSYKYIPTGIATTIHFIYPIVVSCIMMFYFKEKKSGVILLSAVLSLLGVALMCWVKGGMVNLVGVMIVSVTIFTYALYIVGINKSGVNKLSVEILTFYILLIGAVTFFFFAMLSTGIEPVKTASAWGNLFLLAFLPTVLSDLTLILAIKYAGSTITSILGSMEPFVAVCVGIFFLHESFSTINFFGLLLIVLSVVLVILFSRRNTFKES